MSNWHVGQKVVCVSAHPHALQSLVIGRTYTINAIKRSCCKGLLLLDVCLPVGRMQCTECGTMHWDAEWKVETCFRPIDPLHAALDRIESEGVKLTEPQPEFA